MSERTEAEAKLVSMLDPTADLINANRDIILEKHEEAIQLIANITKPVGSSAFSYNLATRINSILKALGNFHPMHEESWEGWPKDASDNI